MATVQKRGNSYSIRVSCGYNLKGQQVIKSMTWRPDAGLSGDQLKKELNRQATLFEEKCRTGQVLGGSIRFADFSEIWFKDYAETQLKAKTIARYQEMIGRINEAIGHIRLDRLQPHHLLEFYTNLGEEGVRADSKYKACADITALLKAQNMTKAKLQQLAGVSYYVVNEAAHWRNINPETAKQIAAALEMPFKDLFEPAPTNRKALSNKTILNHHSLISSILATAVEWQVIPSNPCNRTKPPKVIRKEARYLDEEEAAQILDALRKESIQNQTIVLLLIYTGMRRAELCGLEWGDIDFERQVISVRRSSLYLAEKGVFEDTPKTESSIRSIKVSPEALNMLKRHRVYQRHDRLMLGDQWQENDRIFKAWNGAPIHPDTITSWYTRFIKENNLPDSTLHSLRHTNATLLIAAGTNLETVSKRLGHADITTTSRIYAHAIRSADAAAAETLSDILHPIKK